MESAEKALANVVILEELFSHLGDCIKAQKGIRLLNKHCANETLQKWRKSATVVIQEGHSYEPLPDFLKEFQNISADNDPNGLLEKPFHRYKIITERFSNRLIPAYFENRGEESAERKKEIALPLPPEMDNFWRLCGPHMSHLTLQNISIQNRNYLVKLLNALLFQVCPSLKKLVLEPSTHFPCRFANSEEDVLLLPKARSSLLTSFSFKCFGDCGSVDDDHLKAIFGLMPHLKELQLGGHAVDMIRALNSPVTDSGEFIKLEHLNLANKYYPPNFSNLQEYVEHVNPPLKSLNVIARISKAFGVWNYNSFPQFFTFWSSNLTHLEIKVAVYDMPDRKPVNYFTGLNESDFTNLTHFHLKFYDRLYNCSKASTNASFDFSLLRKMPKLKIFRCASFDFNGYPGNTGLPKPLRGFVPPLKPSAWNYDPDYIHLQYWPPHLKCPPGGADPLLLDNLTQFSFRLNYKFGRYAIQQLKDWAGNLRILEIVIDDEEDFLEFLGNEFQWCRHSLDEVILYCEKDLTDYDTITKAIRRKEGEQEERDVEIQFFNLTLSDNFTFLLPLF